MDWFKKILTIILLGFVIWAGFLLFAGKFKETGRRFLYQDIGADQLYGGDLFEYLGVDKFKERIRKFPFQNAPLIMAADIIMQGDSFFYSRLDSVPFPEYFEKITGQKVFYQYDLGHDSTPTRYLEDIGYQKGEAKFFIYETIERMSARRALSFKPNFSGENDGSVVAASTPTLGSRVVNFLFDQIDVEYFIKNNFIFRPIGLWFKNKAFVWLGDIDSDNPVYLNNPAMLFGEGDIAFGNNKIKFNFIGEMADNIAQEAKIVKDRYNLTLVYLIIPNKFSIYGESAVGGKKYDDFIPKLQEALKDRGVKYLDIYRVFDEYHQQHPSEMLYYAGDNHYTPLGKELVSKELISAGIGLK